jgi:hypothetical protein
MPMQVGMATPIRMTGTPRGSVDRLAAKSTPRRVRTGSLRAAQTVPSRLVHQHPTELLERLAELPAEKAVMYTRRQTETPTT